MTHSILLPIHAPDACFQTRTNLMPNPETSNTPSFEQALQELHQIVADMEDGALDLEASLARYERGTALLRACYEFLEGVEQRIEILTGFDAAGNPVAAPFDATATAERAAPAGGRAPRRRSAKSQPESSADSPESNPPSPPTESLF
jgi:exodeoxyribonuclease VII small subunit